MSNTHYSINLARKQIHNQVHELINNHQVWIKVWLQVGNPVVDQVWFQNGFILHPVWLASVKPEIERLNQHKIPAPR